MKILALEVESPQAQPSDFAPYLQEEAAKVYEHYLSGIFRECYFHQTEHTAVFILECAGIPEAQQVLDSLPLVKAGLITFELIPLAPYPGFGRLFQS